MSTQTFDNQPRFLKPKLLRIRRTIQTGHKWTPSGMQRLGPLDHTLALMISIVEDPTTRIALRRVLTDETVSANERIADVLNIILGEIRCD